MAELKPITINNFQQGVSKSQYTGFSAMANLNINVDGAISQFALPSTINDDYDGVFRWIISGGGNKWGLTSHGKLYKDSVLVTGNTITGSTDWTGCGLAYYNGYIYVARQTAVDRYEIATTTWTNSWQSLTLNDFHQMVIGMDDKLYIANGNKIASYNGTTWNGSAVTLPTYYDIRCLTFLGDNLYMGTVRNDSAISADIFSWDRQSNLADLAVRIEESGVFQMITKNNTIYAVCGINSTLYSTVGTSANKLVSFADYLRSNDSSNFRPNSLYTYLHHPAAISVLNNSIIVGLPIFSFTAETTYPFGIWSYNISNGAVCLLNTTSTNFEPSTHSAEVCCIYVGGVYNYDFSTRRNLIGSSTTIINTYESVAYSIGAYNNFYKNYFESAIYQIGLTNTKRTFNTLNVQLSKPIVSAGGVTQSIQIKYRTTKNGSWTTLGTVNTAGLVSKEFPFAVSGELLQIRCEFAGILDSTTGRQDSPELLSIIIK